MFGHPDAQKLHIINFLEKIENESIKNIKHRGTIFRTHTPCNSPVWPVRKPDMSRHLMIDYRCLNDNTGQLIPNIASLSATLQAPAHEWMAVLDVKDIHGSISGY